MVSWINPASMDIPWSGIALNRANPSMDIDYPEFDETEGAKLYVTVNPSSAEKFFSRSGNTFKEIAALGKDRKPLPHFPLAVSLAAKTKVDVTKIESVNLVAKLPGRDPALKDEYVVLSAHLDDSELGDRTREIAQSLGVKVQPNPGPMRNLFVRSDEYAFIRHGVPSVIMSVAPEPGSPEVKIFKDWLTQRYHAPSDDVDQPVDLAAAAKYEGIVRALLIGIANDDHRPQWKPDSFFRRYAQ